MQIIQNGSLTSITVEKLKNQIYYVKLWANTTAGKGPSSKILVIDITNSPSPTASTTLPSSISSPNQSRTNDPQTWIIIGIIGVLSFIIVIIVFFFVNRRCCMGQNLSLTTHVSSNGHVHNIDTTELTGVHEIESRTPMLTRLSENENSDAKGGGSLIFTSSGTLINGFQVTSGLNGHVPNGHATSFLSTCLDKGTLGNNGTIEGNGETGERDVQGSEQMEPLLPGTKKHESQSPCEGSTSPRVYIDNGNQVGAKSDRNEPSPDLGETDVDATLINRHQSSVESLTPGHNTSNSETLKRDSTEARPLGNGAGLCNVQPVTSNALPDPIQEGTTHHGRANSSCSHSNIATNQSASSSSNASPFLPETNSQSFSESQSQPTPPSSVYPVEVTPSISHSPINNSRHGDQKQTSSSSSSIQSPHQNNSNQHPISTVTTTTTSGPHTNGDSTLTPSTATVPLSSTTRTPSSRSDSSDVTSTNCPPEGYIRTSPIQLSSDSNHHQSTASDIASAHENRTEIVNNGGTTTAEGHGFRRNSGNNESLTQQNLAMCLPPQNQDSAVGVDQGVV